MKMEGMDTACRPDMSVELSGLRLDNPVIPASGTFGFGAEFAEFYDLDILGSFSFKGTTREARFGNPTPRIAECREGMINAVGLQNPGVETVIAEELPHIAKIFHKPVVANISGFSVEDYAYCCEKIDAQEQVGIIEVNISCPNVKHGGMSFGTVPESAYEVTRAVKAVTTKPVYMKLSPNVTDIVSIAKACEEGGADGLTLINTLLGMRIDLRTRRPVIANTMGGFSGPAIFPVALRMVYQVAKACRIPVMGSPAVERMIILSKVQINTMAKDVIIACDFPGAKETFRFLDLFTQEKPFLKIGMELFYAEGPSIVKEIKRRGHRIFLDLKLHDIPNTVKKAMSVLARLDVDMTNVHAAGTIEMMRAALEGLTRPDGTRPLLIAVTQLTSTSEERMQRELLIQAPINDTIVQYARNAKEAGLDGVVCSPLEAGMVHQACGKEFLTITPGVRFADGDVADQVRVTTPARAREIGSDFIVVGRPITAAADPVAAYRRCVDEFCG